MPKQKKSKNYIKILIWTIICLPFAFILYSLLVLFFHIGNISQEEANNKAIEFQKSLQSQIVSVPGYSIIRSAKNVQIEEDEMNNNDYILSVTYRVKGPSGDSVEILKSDMNNLARKLSAKNYAIWIDNAPPINGQPLSMCVSASRYIDNDGKDYSQGISGVRARYTEPNSIKGFDPCAGV